MSTLFNSENPAIAAAQARVLVSVRSATRDVTLVARIDQAVLARAVRDQHRERAAMELNSGDYAPMTTRDWEAAA